MAVPVALQVYASWVGLPKKPLVELTRDPKARFPRFGTAGCPTYVHNTFAGADGRTYASIKNTAKPDGKTGYMDGEGRWHGRGDILPGETQWFVLTFPEK